MAAWKLYMPATLTSRVELLLLDPLTQKAKHGERARITTMLWEQYLSQVAGTSENGTTLIALPRLEDAIFEIEGVKLEYGELVRIVKEAQSVRQPS
jgi:transcriptional regulator